MERWGFAISLLPVLVLLTGATLYGWLRARRRARGLGPVLRLGFALSGAAYLVLILELVFGLFVVKSDGYGVTRAGYRWFQVHWRPINSLGYRDLEPVDDERRDLVLVGDSLVAGHGTDRLEDRFANELQRRLGPDWRVPIAAVSGWNTGEQIKAAASWPFPVERVVIVSTLTDIETAANDVGRSRPEPAITPPPAPFRAVIRHSHLFNWVYWRYIRRDFGARYPDFLNEMYREPTVWQAHEKRMHELIAAWRTKTSDVRVVLWPDLPRVERCAEPFGMVRRFLEAQGVPVLDLSDHFRGQDHRTLINNPLDEHPNVAAQAAVAALVAEWLSR